MCSLLNAWNGSLWLKATKTHLTLSCATQEMYFSGNPRNFSVTIVQSFHSFSTKIFLWWKVEVSIKYSSTSCIFWSNLQSKGKLKSSWDKERGERGTFKYLQNIRHLELSLTFKKNTTKKNQQTHPQRNKKIHNDQLRAKNTTCSYKYANLLLLYL